MVLSIRKEPKDQKNITDFLNLNRVSYQCFFTCLCVLPLSSAYIHSLELVVSLTFSKPLSPPIQVCLLWEKQGKGWTPVNE